MILSLNSEVKDELDNTYAVEGPYELVFVENRTFNYLVHYRVWKNNQYKPYDNAEGKRTVWQKNEHHVDWDQNHCSGQQVWWRV
jgi:hypothetical protein